MEQWPLSVQTFKPIYSYYPFPSTIDRKIYYLPLISSEEIQRALKQDKIHGFSNSCQVTPDSQIYVSQKTGELLENKGTAFIIYYKNGCKKMSFGEPPVNEL